MIIHVLHLWGKIGDEGTKGLREGLIMNSTLTVLNLGGNSIGFDGTMTVGEVLKKNSSLTSIDLSHNTIRIEGALIIQGALRSNSTLTELKVAQYLRILLDMREKESFQRIKEAIYQLYTEVSFILKSYN